MATAKKLPAPTPKAPWGEYVPATGIMDVTAFEHWPDQDGWMFELHQGRLIRMPGPGGVHGDIQSELARIMGNFLATHQLGKITSTACYYMPLPDGREEILCPDLSYSLPLRKATAPFRGSYQELVPDLVIESASPNDTRPAVTEKIAVYLAMGVRLIWVVWPQRKTVEVWRPGNVTPTQMLTVANHLDGADVIPGFTHPVQAIFG